MMIFIVLNENPKDCVASKSCVDQEVALKIKIKVYCRLSPGFKSALQTAEKAEDRKVKLKAQAATNIICLRRLVHAIFLVCACLRFSWQLFFYRKIVRKM